MNDPVTIGALVASAIATAAPEVAKTVVGEAVKDAYKALKQKLMTSAAAEVARPADEQQALRALVEALLVRLKENTPAIGLDIGQLTALEAQLGNITVICGVGARIDRANVESFKVGDIWVGDRSGK